MLTGQHDSCQALSVLLTIFPACNQKHGRLIPRPFPPENHVIPPKKKHSMSNSLINISASNTWTLPVLNNFQDDQTVPLSPIKAAAQERIVRQNTELAEFVSKLNEEKKELRNALANLEEQIAQFRQRDRANEQVTNSSCLIETSSSIPFSVP